ncbi:sn-glycerol-3-phosphate ABC transporter substrate-binding protein UgpB [Candidimonas nitroreducens]|nr:sn-glycerol-3-phosphate ABC transporter substrate-binding protein UgpB [Candidimonas nitroreducens]
MLKIKQLSLMAGAAVLLAAQQIHAAPLEIQFWHPGLGALDDAVAAQVDAFNASQTKYKVVRSARGSYAETLNNAIAAFRAKKQPHMLVAIGASTQTMISSGAIVPVQGLMAKAGYHINWNDYVQPILNYYRSADGKLLSWPFSVSTLVLWYNKEAFKKAGIASPPETWDEVGADAAKLRASGMVCGLTVGWQTWVHVDNYSIMHNVLEATRNNGLDGIDTRLVFNNPFVIKHIERIAKWIKDGRYMYAGRAGGSAIPAFLSKRCGMMIQSSAVYAFLKKGAHFKFAAAPVPHEPNIKLQNNLIGGGTIWVLKGHKAEDYKGVAAFLAFLAKPEQQIKWHKDTGYIPLTNSAYKSLEADGYYKEHPDQEVAIKELTRATPTRASMTIRLGNAAQINAVLDEELESVWAGKKTAKQAMDSAVRRGNEFLERFQQQYQATGK